MEQDILFSALSLANISNQHPHYYLEQERKSTLFKIWKNGFKLGFPKRYAHFLGEIKTLAYLYDIASYLNSCRQCCVSRMFIPNPGSTTLDTWYCRLANKEKKQNMPFYSDMTRGQELLPGVGVDSSVKPSLVLHPVFRGLLLASITRSNKPDFFQHSCTRIFVTFKEPKNRLQRNQFRQAV
jgi:hypothetical protein